MSVNRLACLFFILSTFWTSNGFSLQQVRCIATQNNICITATTKINPIAVERAQYIIQQMLRGSPEIAKRMGRIPYIIDIVGIKQKVIDLPRYRHLQGVITFDGRKFDDLRGFANVSSLAIGEEDLLRTSKINNEYESVFVHEFAHSIKFQMSEVVSSKVERAYLNARKRQLYPLNIYMMASSQEYWAMATEAWFNSTNRVIGNVGINSRERILRRDPEISKVLKQVYGIPVHEIWNLEQFTRPSRRYSRI